MKRKKRKKHSISTFVSTECLNEILDEARNTKEWCSTYYFANKNKAKACLEGVHKLMLRMSNLGTR